METTIAEHTMEEVNIFTRSVTFDDATRLTPTPTMQATATVLQPDAAALETSVSSVTASGPSGRQSAGRSYTRKESHAQQLQSGGVSSYGMEHLDFAYNESEGRPTCC